MKSERRCTGTTDKNYKEICEGDILKASVWSQAKLKTFDAVVVCIDGKFRLKALDNSAIYHFCSISQTRSEVIGNIYDNPELLKESER